MGASHCRRGVLRSKHTRSHTPLDPPLDHCAPETFKPWMHFSSLTGNVIHSTFQWDWVPNHVFAYREINTRSSRFEHVLQRQYKSAAQGGFTRGASCVAVSIRRRSHWCVKSCVLSQVRQFAHRMRWSHAAWVGPQAMHCSHRMRHAWRFQ